VKFECQASPARTQNSSHKRKAHWRLSGDGSACAYSLKLVWFFGVWSGQHSLTS